MTGLDLQIEKYRLKTGLGYIDSIIDFVEENNLCIYEIAEQLHDSIKHNVWVEAKERNLTKNDNNIDTSLFKFLEE